MKKTVNSNTMYVKGHEIKPLVVLHYFYVASIFSCKSVIKSWKGKSALFFADRVYFLHLKQTLCYFIFVYDYDDLQSLL